MNEQLIEFTSQTSYLDPEVRYIFGRNIFEYDIRQANIHALLVSGKLSREEFNHLRLLPKHIREVEIGNRIKAEPELYKDIQRIICQAKYEFMDRNGIQIPQVIRIANDSLFIQTPMNNLNPLVIINDVPIEFVMKNHYMNYLALGPKLLLFCNTNGDYWAVDIKGINESKQYLHQLMISSICNIIDARNNGGRNIAVTEFNKLYNEYITGTLPVEYYRELNADSMYRVNKNSSMETFLVPSMTEKDKNQLDTSYNLGVLRVLYAYLLAS